MDRESQDDRIQVYRVVWNNGNGSASSSLLATDSGLCRVDILWERRFQEKPECGGAEDAMAEGHWSLII